MPEAVTIEGNPGVMLETRVIDVPTCKAIGAVVGDIRCLRLDGKCNTPEWCELMGGVCMGKDRPAEPTE